MDSASLALAEGLVSQSYIRQGGQALTQRRNLIKSLFANRKLPTDGWDDATIELLLQDLSHMDSNNFLGSAGMGEREARCSSSLVHRRHFGMAHGMGRSGNISDEQPKAAGSTLLTRITSLLVKDALNLAGMLDIGSLTLLPVATGMALMLSLQALKTKRPAGARYVVWPRIDQKTCLKAVQSAGLELLVIPNLLVGDELTTNIAFLESEIRRLGSDSIVCVLSTTSCFAARAIDRVEEIAKLCERMGVGHVINNAYGVQAGNICGDITRAWRRGRVDAVIQSTDKNFMVPVGGAIIVCGKKDLSLIHDINVAYPGRASLSPLIDVFITLLSLGASGWQGLLQERVSVYEHLKKEMQILGKAHGERILHTPNNPISLALTLSTLQVSKKSSSLQPTNTDRKREGEKDTSSDSGSDANRIRTQEENERLSPKNVETESSIGDFPKETSRKLPNNNGGEIENLGGGGGVKILRPPKKESLEGISFLGAMLFTRRISGCRVIVRGVDSTVAGIRLEGFGASYDNYPVSYLTAAAAIGSTMQDVDLFIKGLDKCIKEFKRKQQR